MRRKIALLFLIFPCLFLRFPVHAAEPEVSAYAAVLYEPLTGTVLYAKNAEEPLPMASTTKIMTALLAFESGLQSEPVRITEEMTRVEGSSMGLMPGDILPLRELAEGMMMTSGNDSANAIALFLDDTLDDFSGRMNARADEIGMKNTSFVTPSGLDAEGHFSTAHDMALLAAEAMRCSDFAETVGKSFQTVEFIEPQKSLRCNNHNKLLQLYDDCTGIKTGFTKKSGRCLVSSAERNNVSLICVTLNAPDDWNDHIALFEYGFSCFETVSFESKTVSVPVVGGTEFAAVCKTDEPNALLLPQGALVEAEVYLPRFLYAPVRKGESVGSVCYSVNDKEIFSLPLFADSDVEYAAKEERGFIKWAEQLFRRK
ncbi:MAG: D-alanyl-D-alanine carboxypeptidase [Clostridia bacterium]|nr:D-alanyl-D-alanine carboxypeptidase [Clostridia bacterium]